MQDTNDSIPHNILRFGYGTSVRQKEQSQPDNTRNNTCNSTATQNIESKTPLQDSIQAKPQNSTAKNLESKSIDSYHNEATTNKTQKKQPAQSPESTPSAQDSNPKDSTPTSNEAKTQALPEQESTPQHENSPSTPSTHQAHNHRATKEAESTHLDSTKAQLKHLKKTLQADSKAAAKKEQFVLKTSMYSALLLAIFGISFGIYVKSLAIIFDGFIALISVGLTGLSVLTSRYIYKEDDDIFQYGYVRFEPMVNLFKSLVLAFVCVYAFINALQSIINGGYEVELGAAVVYGAVAFVFCIALFVFTALYSKILESDLIKVDNTEWKIDSVQAFGALLAFGVIYALPDSKALARYIDPALLALLSLILCITPIRIAIANFKDLMMVAPPEIDTKITDIMESLSIEFGFSDYDTHVAKSGRFYMVEVNILTEKNFKPKTMAEFDLIREKIESALEIPSYKIWLSVSFTANPKWL